MADKRALLRPPGFEPVVLAAKGSVLQVTTHYTTGQPPYKTRLALDESERLEPAALGLTQITVDGAGRRDAGVKRILLAPEVPAIWSGIAGRSNVSPSAKVSGWPRSTWRRWANPSPASSILEWTETTAEGQQTAPATVKVEGPDSVCASRNGNSVRQGT